MKLIFRRVRQENGLTLVELLAGLFLFSTVITMLYGVLYSGYSLKNKVTQQTTIRNHADVLVNSVLLSLRNVDEVIDVTPYFTNGKTLVAVENMPISALWTTQIVDRGTIKQRRVSYLFTIIPDKSEGATPQHYKLIKEQFDADVGKYLDFTETSYFSISGVKPEPESIQQLNDTRFPLLPNSKIRPDYKQDNDVQDFIDIDLTMIDRTIPGSASFTFQSRVNIN